MSYKNDNSLIKGLQKQDVKALEAAIVQYGGYVMAVALHTLGSSIGKEDAEEIVSDVFVSLLVLPKTRRVVTMSQPFLGFSRKTAFIDSSWG